MENAVAPATQVRALSQILTEGDAAPAAEWQLRSVQSEQCVSYVAWNDRTREALLIDPKDTDLDAYRSLIAELKDYLWLGVIDTHTHADHISIAASLATELKTPLIMSSLAPSQRVDVRVARPTSLPSRAAPIQLVPTPGHTPDSVTVIWGPLLFGGDTILYGDTGRDDLPGGDPEAHYESLQRIKAAARPETIVLPGHDNRGRASTWATQLKVNASLTQDRDSFVTESAAFDAPAPKLLKKSLKENFR